MSTRRASTTASATASRIASRTNAATACTVLATAALLSACGSTGSGAGGTSSTTSTATPSTVTVTVTPTATSTATSATPSSPGKPNTTMTIPPPAKDPVAIPSSPKAYGQAFVTAWVGRDRDDAARLGTTSAVDTAFDSTVKTAPKFTTCEGAAGSSYCTWEGDEYTMTVRILNEAASQRQRHAVSEVKFAH